MKDANDILREDGIDALRAEFDRMEPFEPEQRHTNGNGGRVDAPSLQPKLAATTTTAPLPPLRWIDMSGWDYEPVPEREWAILNRVPLRQAGLFSGEGGT